MEGYSSFIFAGTLRSKQKKGERVHGSVVVSEFVHRVGKHGSTKSENDRYFDHFE